MNENEFNAIMQKKDYVTNERSVMQKKDYVTNGPPVQAHASVTGLASYFTDLFHWAQNREAHDSLLASLSALGLDTNLGTAFAAMLVLLIAYLLSMMRLYGFLKFASYKNRLNEHGTLLAFSFFDFMFGGIPCIVYNTIYDINLTPSGADGPGGLFCGTDAYEHFGRGIANPLRIARNRTRSMVAASSQ